MTDRNTIFQVIESLFEDWILTNKNIHPLAVENMRLLEADALALLKEQEPVVPDREQSEYGGTLWDLCGNCHALISPDDKYCHECGRAVKWE